MEKTPIKKNSMTRKAIKNSFIFEIVIVFPLANHHSLLASNKNESTSDWSILFLGLSNLVINWV